MGKAKEFKRQRKVEKAENEQKKKARIALAMKSGVMLVGVAIVSFGLLKGTEFVKAKWFSGNKQAANTQQAAKKIGDHKYDKAPSMVLDTNKKYIAKFETVDGNFEAELNAKDTPKTVNNFVFLAREKFYDGLTFHRIVKDFMIQGGDPLGTGGGDPGYKFDDEKFTTDYTPGTLAMANSGANTNGSQFFIMTTDYSGGKLPKNYTIFGKVTSGMDVVTKLAATEVADSGSGEKSKPVKAPVINKITIEEK